MRRFLKYVEIKTKITSVFAFLYTLAFLFYHGARIDIPRTLLFFAAMLLFDLTTTSINNYIDSRENGQALGFGRKTSLIIVFALFLMSAGLGLYLAYITDAVVLILGALCFLFGVFYTAGPVPISRMPLGEVFSGVFYGFFIPFILLYINMPTGEYLLLDIGFEQISLVINVVPILTVVLFSVIPACLTANIMLANNICDLKKDIDVKRYTLPHYIGEKSLYLYAALFYLTYISTFIMAAFKILPLISVLSVLTLIPVQKNITRFFKVQDKRLTFKTAIINYIIIMGANTLLIFIGGLYV